MKMKLIEQIMSVFKLLLIFELFFIVGPAGAGRTEKNNG